MSHAAAVTGGSAAGEVFLGAGERLALWLGAPAEDKLPKDAKEGECADCVIFVTLFVCQSAAASMYCRGLHAHTAGPGMHPCASHTPTKIIDNCIICSW